jgi:hypothetical protein
MKTIVSLALLGVATFVGESLAQADNCNKIIHVNEIIVQGLGGAGGRAAIEDARFSMAELPKICEGECDPCAVRSATVTPVGEIQCIWITEEDIASDPGLKEHLAKRLCSQEASVACTCTGREKNVLQASPEVLR